MTTALMLSNIVGTVDVARDRLMPCLGAMDAGGGGEDASGGGEDEEAGLGVDEGRLLVNREGGPWTESGRLILRLPKQGNPRLRPKRSTPKPSLQRSHHTVALILGGSRCRPSVRGLRIHVSILLGLLLRRGVVPVLSGP